SDARRGTARIRAAQPRGGCPLDQARPRRGPSTPRRGRRRVGGVARRARRDACADRLSDFGATGMSALLGDQVRALLADAMTVYAGHPAATSLQAVAAQFEEPLRVAI